MHNVHGQNSIMLLPGLNFCLNSRCVPEQAGQLSAGAQALLPGPGRAFSPAHAAAVAVTPPAQVHASHSVESLVSGGAGGAAGDASNDSCTSDMQHSAGLADLAVPLHMQQQVRSCCCRCLPPPATRPPFSQPVHSAAFTLHALDAHGLGVSGPMSCLSNGVEKGMTAILQVHMGTGGAVPDAACGGRPAALHAGRRHLAGPGPAVRARPARAARRRERRLRWHGHAPAVAARARPHVGPGPAGKFPSIHKRNP